MQNITPLPFPDDASDEYPTVPKYLDPTNQGVHSGSAVITVLMINAVLGVVCVPLWFLLVSGLEVYKTQGAHPDIWLWYVKREHGWRRWLFSFTSSLPFESVTRAYGTDTALYLAFMKYFTLISGCIMVISLTVFLPLHLYSLADNEIDTNFSTESFEDELFTRTTVQAIEQTPWLLYLHVVGVYLNTLICYYGYEEFLKAAKRIFAANAPLETHISNRALKVTNLPIRGVSEADIKAHFEGIVPGQVEAVYFAFDVRQRIFYQEKMEHILLRLKYESGAARPDDKTIDKLRRRRLKYIENIKEWERYPPTACAGFAHVVFKTPEAKVLSLRKVHVCIKPSGCRVELLQAHHPRDINWKEVGRSKTTWAVAINVLLAVGLVFFSTPTAIITTFEEAAQKVTALRDFSHSLSSLSKGSFGALIFQYLPLLFYLILSLVLPLIIEWVTKRQPQASWFGSRQLVMKRLFIYLLLCTFILPSIALSTVSALISVFQNSSHSEDEHSTEVDVSLHHLYLGSSAAFFFNILQVYATLGNYYELWRPLELISYLKSCIWRIYDIKDSWTWVDEFEFGWQYPLVISSFAIAFNYAVFVPLCSLALFIMLFAKLTIHTRHARCNIFCRRNALDSHQFGRLVKTLTVMSHICVLICTFFAACFFLFHERKYSFAPHIGLLFFLIAIVVYRTTKVVRRKKRFFVFDSPALASVLDDDDERSGSDEERCNRAALTALSSDESAILSLRTPPAIQPTPLTDKEDLTHSAATASLSITDSQSPFILPALASPNSLQTQTETTQLRYEGQIKGSTLQMDATELQEVCIERGEVGNQDDESEGSVAPGVLEDGRYETISHHLYAAPFMPERRLIIRLAARHGITEDTIPNSKTKQGAEGLDDDDQKDTQDRSPIRSSMVELQTYPQSQGDNYSDCSSNV